MSCSWCGASLETVCVSLPLLLLFVFAHGRFVSCTRLCGGSCSGCWDCSSGFLFFFQLLVAETQVHLREGEIDTEQEHQTTDEVSRLDEEVVVCQCVLDHQLGVQTDSR